MKITQKTLDRIVAMLVERKEKVFDIVLDDEGGMIELSNVELDEASISAIESSAGSDTKILRGGRIETDIEFFVEAGSEYHVVAIIIPEADGPKMGISPNRDVDIIAEIDLLTRDILDVTVDVD